MQGSCLKYSAALEEIIVHNLGTYLLIKYHHRQLKKIQFKKSNDIDQKLSPPSIVVAYIFPEKGKSPQFSRGGASPLKPSLVYLP